MRSPVFGGVCTTGGSISRPPEILYREAADIANQFHWTRSDIMTMTARERSIWLSQIVRIQSSYKKARERETLEQTQYILSMIRPEE